MFAATGELFAKRRLAPFDGAWRPSGTACSLRDQQENDVVLDMRDTWQERMVWSHHLAPGWKVALISREMLGAFQPRRSVSDIVDGRWQAAGQRAIRA